MYLHDSPGLGEHDGFGFKLKLPKFIRKLKPLKALGKVAKIAAPFIPGVGILGAAAISAGGSVLQKGKKAKLFKDVLKSAAVGGAGRFAVKKLAPKVGGLLKKVPRLLRRAPSLIPGAPDTSGVTLPPELQVQETVEQVAQRIGIPPLFSPSPAPSSYTQIPGAPLPEGSVGPSGAPDMGPAGDGEDAQPDATATAAGDGLKKALPILALGLGAMVVMSKRR